VQCQSRSFYGEACHDRARELDNVHARDCSIITALKLQHDQYRTQVLRRSQARPQGQGNFCLAFFDGNCRGNGKRQEDRNGRTPVSRFRVARDRYLAAALLDKPFYDPESDFCPVITLGSEEWLINLVQVLLIDASPFVRMIVWTPSPVEPPALPVEMWSAPPRAMASIAFAKMFDKTCIISPLLTTIFCKSSNRLSTEIPPTSNVE
jgi:hypothetical protein